MLYLLDSSAVLNDFGFVFESQNSYATTSPVAAEFRDMRSRNLFENAVQQGLVSIMEPEKKDADYVEELAASRGFTRLSKPDISLIALGLSLKKAGREFLLLTDDYSIQNFCSLLKVPFDSAIRGKIRGEISFALSCGACGKALPMASKAKKCPVCGSPLERKSKPEKPPKRPKINQLTGYS